MSDIAPRDNVTVVVKNISNREFLENYAAAGRVGLVGASHFIDIPIKKVQRAVHMEHRDSDWSHALLFEGKRLDDHHWVMESDLDIKGRNVRFGVQENRISKYFDEKAYPKITILDFNLDAEQIDIILRLGLDLVAEQYKYSIRELLGTLVALPSRRLRNRSNILERDRAFYCSAFVQYLYIKVGIDFATDADTKHTAPQHIFQTAVPHTKYLLMREG